MLENLVTCSIHLFQMRSSPVPTLVENGQIEWNECERSNLINENGNRAWMLHNMPLQLTHFYMHISIRWRIFTDKMSTSHSAVATFESFDRPNRKEKKICCILHPLAWWKMCENVIAWSNHFVSHDTANPSVWWSWVRCQVLVHWISFVCKTMQR